MQEKYDLRVLEEHAPRLFAATEGKRLSMLVRQVILERGDPRLARVSELQQELQASGDAFFLGWDVLRRYTRKELDCASCS